MDNEAAATAGAAQQGAALVDAEAQATCDAVAARWRTLRGAEVLARDTLLHARNLIPDYRDDSYEAEPDTASYPGCYVYASHPDPPADVLARGYWRTANWPHLYRISADGPGGETRTYQLDRVRCQVAEEWDPGDDSDPQYVPGTYHAELTLCWRHGRLIEAQDTASGDRNRTHP